MALSDIFDLTGKGQSDQVSRLAMLAQLLFQDPVLGRALQNGSQEPPQRPADAPAVEPADTSETAMSAPRSAGPAVDARNAYVVPGMDVSAPRSAGPAVDARNAYVVPGMDVSAPRSAGPAVDARNAYVVPGMDVSAPRSAGPSVDARNAYVVPGMDVSAPRSAGPAAPQVATSRPIIIARPTSPANAPSAPSEPPAKVTYPDPVQGASAASGGVVRPGVVDPARQAALSSMLPKVAEPPMPARSAPEQSIIRQLVGPLWDGPEGKLRLLQVLADAGGAYMQGRASNAAAKRSASSAGLANVANAISGGRANQRGTEYAPKAGLLQSLAGVVGGGARVGQQAIAQAKAEKLAAEALSRAEAKDARDAALRAQEQASQAEDRVATRTATANRDLREATNQNRQIEATAARDAANAANQAAQLALDESQGNRSYNLQAGNIATETARYNAAQAAAAAKATGKAGEMSPWRQKRLDDITTSRGMIKQLDEGLDAARFSGVPIVGSALTNDWTDPVGNAIEKFSTGITLRLASAFNDGRPTQSDFDAVAPIIPGINTPKPARKAYIALLLGMSDIAEEALLSGMVISGNPMKYVNLKTMTFDREAARKDMRRPPTSVETEGQANGQRFAPPSESAPDAEEDAFNELEGAK